MCGGRVLIKHGGIFNEGCNKRQIASIISVLFFLPVIHMCNASVLCRRGRLPHICSFVCESKVRRQ